METPRSIRLEQRRKQEREYQIFFWTVTSIIIMLVVVAVIIWANGHNNSVVMERQTKKDTVSVCKSSIPDKPLTPIVYEETFLYKEELAEMKRQEELKRQQEKAMEEAKHQEELRKKKEAEAAEFLCLQKLVYAEAQGESFEGKILVAAAVVNRKKDSSTTFPNTIREVIAQSGQFTNISYITPWYIENMYDWQKEAWEECRVAAEKALAGEDPAAKFLGGPTLYFYNPDKCSQEQLENRDGIEMYIVGNHNFHHEPPRG